MKTLMVGAGIIGTIFGWAYAQAGHEVTHLVRPGRTEKYKDGFQIDMYDVRKGHKKNFTGHYAINVTETVRPEDNYELVIVLTKHYHLLETLKQIVPLTGDADYFLMTQNWEGSGAIDAILPSSRYVFGDAKAGGKFEGNTLIGTIASVDIGQVNGRHDPGLEKVIALCRSAQVGVTVQENILHYLWVQYAITGGLWPALVKAGSIEAVLDNRPVAEQGIHAARECLEVVSRRGVDLRKYPETRMYLNTAPVGIWIAGLVIKAMFRFNKLVQRSSLHGLDDIEEVKVFYYELLNMGRNLGVEMPALCAFEEVIRTFGGQS